MSEIFLVYSMRMNAWVAYSGTGTSETSEARHFSREEAIAFCKKAKSPGRPMSFPVPYDLILEVRS